MPTCLPCEITTENGRVMVFRHACSHNGLLTCVDDIQNDPDGNGKGLGFEEVWPKRYSTLMVGRHAAEEGLIDANYYSTDDNEAFLGDVPNFNQTGAASFTYPPDITPEPAGGKFGPAVVPCPLSIPAHNDGRNNIEADAGAPFINVGDQHRNVLRIQNTFGFPVAVKVKAFDWYMDMNVVSHEANGGARWLGEARLTITEPGRTFDSVRKVVFDTNWQRGAEISRILNQNGAYASDPRGLEASFNAFSGQLTTVLNGLKECVAGPVADGLGPQSTNAAGDPTTPVSASPCDYVFPIQPITDFEGNAATIANRSRTGAYANDRGTHRHAGMDLSLDNGDTLVAVTDGVIVQTITGSASAGNFIVLRGDDGFFYRYLHMQGFAVANGQRVAAGETIGTADSTGRSSGPHLHFEKRRDSGFSFNGSLDPTDDLLAWYNQDPADCEEDEGGTPTPDPADPTPDNDTTSSSEVSRCVNNLNGAISSISGLLNNLRFVIQTADNPVPGNPAYTDRTVEVEGAWFQTITLGPGQTLETHTRSRFSHWDRDQRSLASLQTHSFCDSNGRSRPGQITFNVMPAVGGRQCDDSIRYLGPLNSNQGSENGGTDSGRNQGLTGN